MLNETNFIPLETDLINLDFAISFFFSTCKWKTLFYFLLSLHNVDTKIESKRDLSTLSSFSRCLIATTLTPDAFV